MLSWVEHEKSFITSGPELIIINRVIALTGAILVSGNKKE